MKDQEEDGLSTPNAQSDDEEPFVVTRPEDERDPEAEAEFDRELAKMMTESMETRRIEKRPMLEIALPTRRAQQDTTLDGEEMHDTATTKFSLLSKRGNKPQVCRNRVLLSANWSSC